MGFPAGRSQLMSTVTGVACGFASSSHESMYGPVTPSAKYHVDDGARTPVPVCPPRQCVGPDARYMARSATMGTSLCTRLQNGPEGPVTVLASTLVRVPGASS
jgi:hypothetical protein